VQSALLSVKGVGRAQVSFERREAIVSYDPSQCSVDDLIAAVGQAKVPMTTNRFGAKVKNPSSRI
jgi:copper chaperone CopZ